MTDPAGLTPEQDAVRRLLADARHDEPAPPEVVARLDETLASLVSERGSVDDQSEVPRTSVASVVDLGARRRRTVGIGLLAAAAVVVAGVAIGQGLPRMQGSDGSADSAAGGDSSLAESDEDFGGGSDAGSGAAEQSPESLKSSPPAADSTAAPFRVSRDTLRRDLLRLRALPETNDLPLSRVAGCDAADIAAVGVGRSIPIDFDGIPAIAVFELIYSDDGRQPVSIVPCDRSVPSERLALPAP